MPTPASSTSLFVGSVRCVSGPVLKALLDPQVPLVLRAPLRLFPDLPALLDPLDRLGPLQLFPDPQDPLALLV